MDDRRIRVVLVTKEGEAHITTFEGWGAEACALNYFGKEKEKTWYRYGTVLELFKGGWPSEITFFRVVKD